LRKLFDKGQGFIRPFDRSTVRPFDCVGGGTWTAAHQGTSGWLLGVFTGDGSRDLMRTTTAGTDVLI